MYFLKTPRGIVEIEEPDLRRRIEEQIVLPWDGLSTDGERFIQIRGYQEFRDAFAETAVAITYSCCMHEERDAEQTCAQCGRGYCHECLPAPNLSTSSLRICPACGDRLSVFQDRSKEKAFWQELGHVLLYPLSNKSWVTTLGIAFLLWAGFQVLPFTLIFWFIGLSYVVHVIASSAEGKRAMGFGPDIDDLWMMIGRGFLAALVSIVVAVPFLILNFYILRSAYYGSSAGSVLGLLLLNLPLAVVAFVYYPMALAMTAIWHNRWVVFRPDIVLSHILLIKGDYLIMLGAWGVLLAVEFVLRFPFRFIPILGGVFGSLISAYFTLVRAHILGLTMYKNESRLGWD